MSERWGPGDVASLVLAYAIMGALLSGAWAIVYAVSLNALGVLVGAVATVVVLAMVPALVQQEKAERAAPAGSGRRRRGFFFLWWH